MITIKNLRNAKPKYEFDVRVDRESILGNPFHMKDESQREIVCKKYAIHFENELANNQEFKKELDRLALLYKTHGKLNLFCWCSPKQCHAEIIRDYIIKLERELI